MAWREWTPVGNLQKAVVPKQTYVFVIESHIDDVSQGHEPLPDLVESIMKAPGLLKEGIQPMLFKTVNLDPNTTEILKFKIPKSVCQSPPRTF